MAASAEAAPWTAVQRPVPGDQGQEIGPGIQPEHNVVSRIRDEQIAR